MSFGFPNLRKHNGPNDHESSSFESSELHGFVCPECLASFSSSEDLIAHFKLHEVVHNVPSSTAKLERAPGDKSNAASYTELLDEMSKHNNLLLEQISSQSRHIFELETALELLISGSPVSPNFDFSDAELKRKVIAFLESQTQLVTVGSELEMNRQELVEKRDQIDQLKMRITQLEESASSMPNNGKRVLSMGDVHEGGDEEKQNEDFSDCKDQLRVARDEIVNLQAQLEAIDMERSSVGQKTPFIDASSLQTELESVYGELNRVRAALAASESHCAEMASWSDKHGPGALLVSEACQTEVEMYPLTESENTTGASASDHVQTVDLTDELNAISAELKKVQARLEDSETRRHSEDEAAKNHISILTASLKNKQAELKEVQTSYETQITVLTTESNRLKAELERSSTMLAQIQSERDSLQAQVQTLTEWRECSERTHAALEQQLHREQADWDSERTELRMQLTKLQQTLTEMEVVKDELEKRCTNLTKQLTDHESLVSSVEAQLANRKQDAEEAQAQLQLSRKEVESLLERLITSEDKSTSMEEQVRLQSQEVERLKKAIFELGRENQSLQMLRERVTNRQWTKDDNVAQCSGCHAEFSLTNRKHHCRQCGGIFCHGCSAQRASIAASKDPVRVCGPCYTELTGSGSH